MGNWYKEYHEGVMRAKGLIPKKVWDTWEDVKFRDKVTIQEKNESMLFEAVVEGLTDSDVIVKSQENGRRYQIVKDNWNVQINGRYIN